MKKEIVKFYIIAIVAAFFSCNPLDLTPTDRITDVSYWTSAEKAEAVLNQAYSQMYTASYYFNTECLSDNLYQRNFSNEKQISSGQADAANGRFASEWRDCYAGIKYCHIFLKNVDLVTMDETVRERMKAEARFIRAFLYFRLANWYGAVPWFDYDPTLEETKTISRTPKDEVVSWVREELNEMMTKLPTKQQYAASDNGRITRGAAATLLARTYLYENDWRNVANVCEKIIAGDYGQYSLFKSNNVNISSYEGLFLPQNEYNNEVILDISYVPAIRTWDTYRDAIPLTVGGRVNSFAPTQDLVDDYIMQNGRAINESGSGYPTNPTNTTMYQNRDPRFAQTIVHHGYNWKNPNNTISTINVTGAGAGNNAYTPSSNSTSTGYFLRKWYDPTAPLSDIASGLNLILMRYADVLLMYAEAKNELNEMNNVVWDMTIRPIRERAGFTDDYALDYNISWNMRQVIRRERRCELVMEGTRIHDIRRWKTAEIVLNTTPRGASWSTITLDARRFNAARDYLWPVPQAEKDINPNLGQNSGY
ncbi:RagB/SusD family nutrient uptake outer membrane protein [Gaoshiqia sp. Z1-71]|uniref:RagB/SusD family nutrient uptake outer membrane protein n=1 Tax=Gaoshiqia hydrogeniformans TaxID=3290090 RepID=UPI003BF7FEA2